MNRVNGQTKWHTMMAANFRRVASGCSGRGYPESKQYFDKLAFDHDRAKAVAEAPPDDRWSRRRHKEAEE